MSDEYFEENQRSNWLQGEIFPTFGPSVNKETFLLLKLYNSNCEIK